MFEKYNYKINKLIRRNIKKYSLYRAIEVKLYTLYRLKKLSDREYSDLWFKLYSHYFGIGYIG